MITYASLNNIIPLTLVKKSDGSAITSGTVTFYLQALSGTNIDKWFRASDSTWQVVESSAGVATHTSDGHWKVTIAAVAWTAGVRYFVHAKESGGLHIPTGVNINCEKAVDGGAKSCVYTLTDDGTELPIPQTVIWVTTDLAGANLIAGGITDDAGQFAFTTDLDTGDFFYVWRHRARYTFDDPDTETVQ